MATHRQSCRFLILSIFLSCTLLPAIVQAETLTFVNDFPGWVAAAKDYSLIDFETLPSGSPSTAGYPITPADNYTAEGAVFTVICEQGGCQDYELIITGNPVSGYGLTASTFDWDNVLTIRTDLAEPTPAVGTFFPGNTTFSAYGLQDELIGTATYNGSGEGFFIGFVSSEPIAYTLQSRGYDIESSEAFVFGTDLSIPLESWTWGLVKNLYR